MTILLRPERFRNTEAEINSEEDSCGFLLHGRIPSLDGLRALAVLLVLITHASQTRGFPRIGLPSNVLSRNDIGVEIFFVISGFLITTLMLRERQRTGALDVRAFYFRRILRILPAYCTFLIVVGCVEAMGHAPSITQYDWISALTYTVNFRRHPAWEIGHIWSLSIEEHFYLIWPAVVFTGIAFARFITATLLIGCFILRWMILFFAPRYSPMAELWTFTRLDTIAFGCALALLAWNYPWRQKLNRASEKTSLILLGAGTLVISNYVLSVRSAKYAIGIGYSLHAFLISYLLWCAIQRPSSYVGRVLAHPLIASIGIGSYSLYLWQQIFLVPQHHDMMRSFPQNILFACLAALVSYRYVERPFLGIKNRNAIPKGLPAEPSDLPIISAKP